MNALLIGSFVWAQVLIPGKTPVQQFGIDDKGETVVTNSDNSSGIYGHGTFTPLPPPPASCACQIGGIAVNDSGVVVGVADPASGTGPRKGFILNGSTYTFFSRPGWDNTEPRGISNQGLVVGWSYSKDTTQSDGFIYDPSNGTFTDVTPGSGSPSIVQGINRFGRIAGTFVQPSPRKLYGLVSQKNELSAFGATQVPFAQQFQLGGAATRARGINDFGITAGFTDFGGTTNAFVGNDSWGYEIVVPPGGGTPQTFSICTGINNLGQVACSVTNADVTITLGLYIGTPGSP